MRYVEAESNAKLVETFDVGVVPGLFQTEAYARGVIEQYRYVNPDEIRELSVQLRLDRQWHAFERDNPLKIHSIIDEAALWRTLTGPQVQHEQLLHLIDLASLSHITLQVVPLSNGVLWGDHSILFAIFHSSTGLLLSREPSFEDVTNSNNPLEIAHYRTAFAQLSKQALSPDRSLAMIRNIASQVQRLQKT
jgi:hypothetical protein